MIKLANENFDRHKPYIVVDNREKRNFFVVDYFKAKKCDYEWNTLPYGDYKNLNNFNVVVERKQDILEICGNLTKQHARFKREIEKAMYDNCFIYCVIGDEKIYSLEGVKYWKSPRYHQYGKPITQVKGSVLYKIMKTMESKYPIKFMFVKEEQVGKVIYDLLTKPPEEESENSKMELELCNEYLRFRNIDKCKKITGTLIAGLCEENPFQKRGDIMCERLGIIKSDEINPFYTIRGAKAEEIVRELFKSNGYEVKWWIDREIDYDNFPQEKLFGGLMDLNITKGGKTRVVEIKSKNIKDKKKVMTYGVRYQELQGELYSKLSGYDLVMCWVFFDDYAESCLKEGKEFEPKEHCEFYMKEFKLKDYDNDISRCMKESAYYYNTTLEEGFISTRDLSDGVIKKIEQKIKELKEIKEKEKELE